MPKVNKPKISIKDSKEKPFHPYSRKALQLNKQLLHGKKVENAKTNHFVKLDLIAEKLIWFQEHLDDRHVYTKQDMVDLVMEYRNRFSDELKQISITRSVGNRYNSKQHVSRETCIKMSMEEETNQFESSGIEVPDLINKKHLEEFKKWNGEVKFIQNLKLRKISSMDLKSQNDGKEENVKDSDFDV